LWEGVKEIGQTNPEKNIIGILKEVVFHAKDRNERVRKTGRKYRRSSLRIPTVISPQRKLEKVVDTDTNMIQKVSLQCADKTMEMEDFSDEGNPQNMEPVIIPSNALEDSCNISIGNNNLPQMCIAGGQEIKLNGGDTSHNAVCNNISMSGSNNSTHMSPLYMKDENLDNKVSTNHGIQSSDSIYALGRRSSGIQWDGLGGPDDLSNNSFISSKNESESKDFVNSSLSLEKEEVSGVFFMSSSITG